MHTFREIAPRLHISHCETAAVHSCVHEEHFFDPYQDRLYDFDGDHALEMATTGM